MEERDRPQTVPMVVLANKGWNPLQTYTQDNGPDHISEGLPRYIGTVLAQRLAETDNPDRWAVWAMMYNEATYSWDTVSGDYFSDLNQARFCFGWRLHQSCWGATLRGIRAYNT